MNPSTMAPDPQDIRDLQLMHEVIDDDDKWSIEANVYEHERHPWNGWQKTGEIVPVYIQLTIDGHVVISIGWESVFYDNIWELKRIIEEHRDMQYQLEKLKKHGIGFEDGTLSIKLWE